jgi:hypothetical protein
MQQPEKVINQTLLIWCGVVIVEIFVIAHLMQFPWLVFSAFIMYWPGRAAMNWPAPVEKAENAEPKALTEGR